MQYITIEGVASKRKTKLLRSLVHFCLDTLMPEVFDIKISVELDGLEEGIAGWCIEGDSDYHILLDRTLTRNDLILALCHEMVHVWQSTTGRGVYLDDGRKQWLGEIFSENHFTYEEEPWEIEAYELQDSLAEAFSVRRSR